MKKLVALVLVLLCIFALAGCEATGPHNETTLPPAPTEQSSTVETPAPTELSTIPPETESATTAPTQNETIPPQVIVQPEPNDEDFVKVKTYIPDIVVDLRYSTENNFTNQKIYVKILFE